MKVLLIAHDAGQSAGLQALLKVRPDWKAYLLNAGKVAPPEPNELVQAILDTDVVVTGLASENTKAFEIGVCLKAMAARKPLAFFSDTFGAWSRPWFAEFRDYVSLVTVVVASEIAAAEKMFPNARVVATGNPAWEEFHAPYDRGDQLKLWKLLEAKRSDQLILISGCKDAAVNKEMILAAFGAADDASAQNEFQMIFSLHPGDKTPPHEYHDFCGKERAVWPLPWANFVTLTSDQMRGDVAVGGVDVVFTYNTSSVAMRAIAHGQPVIVLRTPLAAARLLSESGSIEHPFLPQAAIDGGGSLYGDSTLVGAFLTAYDWGSSHSSDVARRTNQAAFFPPIAQGAYITALVAAIEGVAVSQTTP